MLLDVYLCKLGRHTCVCLKGTALTEFSVSDTIAASGAGRHLPVATFVRRALARYAAGLLRLILLHNDCFLAGA